MKNKKFVYNESMSNEEFFKANPHLKIIDIKENTDLREIVFKGRRFAEGGLIMGPTMGMIGEAGPELLLPKNEVDKIIKKKRKK